MGYTYPETTLRYGGVRFRIYPQDHDPIHAHGRYAETVAIVELRADGTVTLADRADAVIPADAKRTDVRRILDAADAHYSEIKTTWEKMHRED